MTTRSRWIVVVAYGAAPLLRQTLETLSPTERVIVVDNSSDPEVEAACTAASVEYIDPEDNLGFAGAVNVALRALRSRDAAVDVLLLNPDAAISTSQIDALQGVFLRAGNATVGAVSPALATPDGVRQRVLWPYPSPKAMWLEALGLGRFRGTGPQFAVGAVLLLRCEALAAVGDLDERYFLYAEEADWQRRAADLGWRSVVAGDVVAVHIGGGTSIDADPRDRMFHAGQQTYIRRWFGPLGWTSYRLAAIVGASIRALVLTGPNRTTARSRARIYLRGRRQRAVVTLARASLRLTHVVVTGNAAGTERYVGEVATRQASAGHQVTVIGGSETFMKSMLPDTVTWRAAETVYRAAAALRTGGSQDIVHTHLTSADLVGVLTSPWHGAAVVSTRHIAKPRGSSRPLRRLLGILQRRIGVEICISDYVKQSIGIPATVLHNGVRADTRRADAKSKVVLMAQRLEPEKANDVALAGWHASGLAACGWKLLIYGTGSQREPLQKMAAQSGIEGVIFKGWDDDLPTTMLDAAILLAAAPEEPCGLTVLEAMSVGLPVVAAAGGGHLETVGRYPGAALFAPGDSRDCGEKLMSIASMSTADRVAYGGALKRLQQDSFDVVDHVRKLDQLYRTVLR